MPTQDPISLLVHSPTILLAIAVLAASWLFYMVQVGRRKKERFKYKLKKIVIGETVLIVAFSALQNSGMKPVTAVILSILIALGITSFINPPDPTRRIPLPVKRAVIARDLKGGQFDPKIHHIHHIVPFSRGGDNSIDNLKILSKGENFRRGAKMPRFRDFV